MSGGAAAALPAPAPHASGGADRAELALWGSVAVIVLAAMVGAARGFHPLPLLAAVVVPLVFVVGQRVLLAWPTLLGAVLLVILFVPIRRYTVGGPLPIELEPYRVLIAVVFVCWLAALAVDPAARLRSTGYTAVIATLWLAILVSIALNLGRVNAVNGIVIKQLTFFGSYFLLMSFVASVIRRGSSLDRMLKLLVGGGAIVAVAALVEWRTGTNVFNGLGRFIPFLHYQDQGLGLLRGTGTRALGSAQHPIALGAALVMLLPLAVYLFKRTGNLLWLGAGGLLTLAALSTGSRTAALMLVVLLVCFLALRRGEVIRMLPQLLALMVVIQVAMPGTLGTFKGILNPSFIVEEQSAEMGTGSGRIADLGPSLAEWSAHPFFGAGFGTRIVDDNAGALGSQQILDDQWLGTLLEIGAVGVLALLWLFARAIRRLARRARSDTGSDAWLATGLASSIAAYAFGMFTFDSFAFIQVTFLVFIMLGFGAVVARGDPDGGRLA